MNVIKITRFHYNIPQQPLINSDFNTQKQLNGKPGSIVFFEMRSEKKRKEKKAP